MKILYITPHLSTGGCPQFLLKKIQVLHKDHEIYCIEYADHGCFTVQKNKIKEILKDRLIEVNYDRSKIIDIIKDLNPDVVHLEEMPEYFMDREIAEKIYVKNRRYKIIETSHDSSFDPKTKLFFPDKLIYVSKYQKENLKELDIPSEVCEYPILINPRKPRADALRVLGLDPKKKHVVHVGLFTPRKNQKEIIEYAKLLKDHPIQFHFIGNQADNFKGYWEPLMKDFPSNCKWWNERKDVDNFYQAADLFLFVSKDENGDKETSPLVIREAISYNIPTLIYNSPVYMGMYDKYNNISYLDYNSREANLEKILRTLNMTTTNANIFYTLQGELPLASYDYPNSMFETMNKHGDAAAMYWGTFLHKELERFDVKVSHGDVFVDLGANIGMSSRYASLQGASETHCFEPDPKIAELLRKNVPTATVYEFAIDSQNKDLELYHWPFNPVNQGPKYKTKTKTLRDVIKMIGKPIDYLKVDIESFEENLFDDISKEELAVVKKMFIEHHIPEKLQGFCERLRKKGFDVQVEYGSGQNYIYAEKTKLNGYPFNARWDLNEQKVTYSCAKNINFPILIALREYQSNAVLWAVDYPSLPTNCEFWMVPIPKSACDYSTYKYCSGVKFCVYNKETNEQIYEQPFYHKFVNMPATINFSNRVPYFINYLEYFINDKYGKWLNGKKFNTVVDAGANIGIFTEYLIRRKIAKKITAIECDAAALSDLSVNYEVNDNVTIIGKALSHSSDPITFYSCPENSVISSTIAPDNVKHHRTGLLGSQQNVVETVTVKDMVEKLGHIDLLKIDIEGAEYKIIENLDPALAEHIDNMFIECHFFESDYKEKYINLVNKVKSMGYNVETDVVLPIENYAGASECIFATKNI
jgi:FkbM family methyltransferase